MVHFPTGRLIPEPELTLADLPQRRGAPGFLRPFLSPAPLSDSSYRPGAARLNSSHSRHGGNADGVLPEDGAEIIVGVMIALPVEEGKGAEKWRVEETEEAEVPELCLGVMGCRLKSGE